MNCCHELWAGIGAVALVVLAGFISEIWLRSRLHR
jgi:hypothetical protein